MTAHRSDRHGTLRQRRVSMAQPKSCERDRSHGSVSSIVPRLCGANPTYQNPSPINHVKCEPYALTMGLDASGHPTRPRNPHNRTTACASSVTTGRRQPLPRRCPRALGHVEQPYTPTPRTSCDRVCHTAILSALHPPTRRLWTDASSRRVHLGVGTGALPPGQHRPCKEHIYRQTLRMGGCVGVEPSAQTVFTHCSTSGAEREVSTPAAPVCEECERVNRPQCIARNGRGVGAPVYTDRSSCSRQTSTITSSFQQMVYCWIE